MVIPLTQHLYARVNISDFNKVRRFKWYTTKSSSQWYARRTENGKQIYMHRFIMQCPVGSEVHHLDGDGLNNRRSNLVVCSRKENLSKRKYGKG